LLTYIPPLTKSYIHHWIFETQIKRDGLHITTKFQKKKHQTSSKKIDTGIEHITYRERWKLLNISCTMWTSRLRRRRRPRLTLTPNNMINNNNNIVIIIYCTYRRKTTLRWYNDKYEYILSWTCAIGHGCVDWKNLHSHDCQRRRTRKNRTHDYV